MLTGAISQLYHTKLEQLLTLTGRLSTLSNTLGPDFYSPDILDPTPAAGEDEYDSLSHRDVTPDRFSRLEKELVRGKGEVVGTLLSRNSMALTYRYTAVEAVDTLVFNTCTNRLAAYGAWNISTIARGSTVVIFLTDPSPPALYVLMQ